MSANMPRSARPQRNRKASRKHADSVQWTEETMQILRASSESSDRSSTSSESEILQKDRDVVLEDFAPEAVQDDEKEDIELDRMSEDSAQPESVDGDPQTPTSKKIKMSKSDRLRRSTPNASGRVQMLGSSKISFADKGVRNRMMLDSREIIRSGNADCVYQQNYGPLLEDLYHIIQSRDFWHVFPRDITLPSKQSLTAALNILSKGYLTMQIGNPKNTSEDSVFTKTQISQSISLEQAIKNKFFEPGVARSVVLGSRTSARKFSIEYLKPLDISVAWLKSGLSTTHSDPMNMQDAWHRAWVINTGAQSDCLAWAYSRSDEQYLAAGFRCSQAQRAAAKTKHSRVAPAFSASPDYPSSIHIWKIQAVSTTASKPQKVDYGAMPTLSQVLCFKWGNILHFEWVPIAQEVVDIETSTRSMALLTSDGCVRLIDIDLTVSHETTYTEYKSANIVLRPPPTTIFTSFCFVSKSDMIAGAADGAVRIYNLTDSASSDGTCQPYLTHQIHTNYIMAVAASPELPYYVCSSSASGDMVLNDLRSPNIDRIALHKARHPTRNLSYSPFIRTFITTNDGAGNSEPTGTAQCTVVAHSIRHFQYINTIMKLPDSSGLTTCLATSPFHPCLLVANAQGSVFATNHLRRYLPVSHAGSSWMQKIFQYDWRPLAESCSANGQVEEAPTHSFVPSPSKALEGHTIDLYHGRDARIGISRIHEGFRPERVDLGPQSKKTARKTSTLATTQAVFHEEQAVTAMVWNPNPKFAGWAAIAWGGGLLRIQDLSHDLK